jgi:hypothetical protein
MIFSRKTREEREQARQDRLLRKQQLEEARFFGGMIPSSLARQKIAFFSKNKGKLDINPVQIKPPVLIHEDYYMVEVNTARLPYGVKLDQLKDPETVETLSAACRSPVEVRWNASEGFWYLIPRRGGLGIIPRVIDYEEVLDLMPDSANIWTIPIGVTENKKLIKIDIRKVPHMMVIGSTGTGKTVFLKSMLLTLASNCSPRRLRMVICDYKRGPDFKSFTALPHLGTPAPVSYDEAVIGLREPDGTLETEKTGDYLDRILIHLSEIMELLKWSREEIDRRNAMYTEEITNIDEWNAHHRRAPLPHLLIIVDEVGVMMNRLKGKEAAQMTELLADIAMLGRSAGIHLVLGLQKVVRTVLDGAISDNIEARIVGRCASGPQSAMAMGNGSWSAARLPAGIKGRAMWRDEHGELEIQLPWVPPELAIELNDYVIGRWADGHDNEDQQAMDVFRWCLAEQDGHYHIDHVYQHWRNFHLNRADVQLIREDYLVEKDEEGNPEPVIKIDDVEYVLVPHVPGVRPSKVIPLAHYLEKQNQEPVEETRPVEPVVTPEEMLAYAHEHLEGRFPIREIHQAFKDRGLSQYAVEKFCKENEGLEHGGYVLEPQPSRTESRTVSRITNHEIQKPKTTNPKSGDDVLPTKLTILETRIPIEDEVPFDYIEDDEDDPDANNFIDELNDADTDDVDELEDDSIPEWLDRMVSQIPEELS